MVVYLIYVPKEFIGVNLSKYMTKKILTCFLLASLAKRGRWGSFFRALPEKMNPFPTFSHEQSCEKALSFLSFT